MGDLPVSTLAFLLVSAVLLSAFFSGTETALMSVNRYRLRHLAREGSRSARTAEKLLERPDRLIGMILICNNFVNSAAAAIVTLIALSIGGESIAATATPPPRRSAWASPCCAPDACWPAAVSGAPPACPGGSPTRRGAWRTSTKSSAHRSPSSADPGR